MEINVETISKLRNFLKEFDFSGNSSARFVNTLIIKAKQGKARDYLINYFKLIDSPYASAVIEKTRSVEFRALVKELKEFDVNPINKRFELYFGNQGTGKTTFATKVYPCASIMPCNSSFEPCDLIETFDFDDGKKQLDKLGIDFDKELESEAIPFTDKVLLFELLMKAGGKPKYKPTPLLLAMLNGETVILDEINLLTRDCLRALQSYLDNKDRFEFKGTTIHIKEGFKVIGTMNLEVNGQIEALPAPLVDRAKDIEEFELSDEILAKLASGE